MKFYQLNKVKQQIILNSGIKNDSLNSFKESLRSNYHIDVVEKLSLAKVYMMTDSLDYTLYLNEEQIEKVNLMAKLKTGLNLNFNDLPYIESDNFVEFPFNSKKDIPEINKEYRDLDSIRDSHETDERTIRKLANKERSSKYGHVNNSLEGKRVVSIDFEFNPNAIVDKYELDFISEIGITTSYRKAVQSKHFIIEENKKEKLKELNFLRGNSQFINIAEIKSVLEQELKNADVLVVHSYNAELKFLADNNIKHDHFNILDIQLLYKHYFDNNDENLKKLSKILLKLNIDYAFLHNAGNDAYYTHLAFDKMIGKIDNKKRPSFKI